MEKQNKSTVLQWIALFAILMIVVLIILLDFSVKSNTSARESVSDEMVNVAQKYADQLSGELGTMKKVVKSVCTLLEQDTTLDDVQAVKFLKIIEECTEASEVEFCDGEGNGINQMGEAISIGEKAYFQNIPVSEDSLLYVEESEHKSQRSIVMVEHVGRGEGHYVIVLYPVERFEGMLSVKDLDSGTFLALVDEEGRVLSTSGADSNILCDSNIVNTLQVNDSGAADKIREYFSGGLRGEAGVKVGDESRVLIYVPLDVQQWGIVMGVEQEYVNGLVSVRWKNTKNMLVSLIVGIFIFGCIVTAVGIFGRIRDNQQKKELEDKADTDLLTTLNNKLATERKIKAYMAQNPQSQSVMFLFDVDNFKMVNDTMGHAFGDEVLSTLGRRIKGVFRASDIIGRVGGDEFMIFLKAVQTPENVLKEAKKVEDFFRNLQVGEKEKYDVRASIGVAVFPHEGANFETLYKAADEGLYKAKRRGKNQLAFYEDKWAEAGGEREKKE